MSSPIRLDTGGSATAALDRPARTPIDLDAWTAQVTGLAGGTVLLQGDPLRHPKLPRLLQSLAGREIWLETDGLPLTSPVVRQALVRFGVTGVRLWVHAAAADAHDWLVGQPGALRRTLRAQRALMDDGLTVHWSAVLTRPTVPLLTPWVDLGKRMGARALWLRRLQASGPAEARFASLSPRLGLLTPLEAALDHARTLRIPALVADVPRCVVPGAPLAPAERCTDPCETCPGAPDCGGWPVDYGTRFGLSERPRQRVPAHGVREVVVDPGAPSREVRILVAKAGGELPDVLRLVDVFAHPEGEGLVRDALRMGLPRVEVTGWGDGIERLSAPARLAFARLAAVELTLEEQAQQDAVRGAGSWARTRGLLEQLGRGV